MPDGKSKIKFNAEYLNSIQVCISNCSMLYERIPKAVKGLHKNNLINSIATLQAIKDYAAFNGAQIPRKPYGLLTHDAAGHRVLAKGALAVKQLRDAAPAGFRKLAVKALDCIVVFENQMPNS